MHFRTGGIWESVGHHFGKSTYKAPSNSKQVINMDRKFLIVAAAIALLAFAGIAFAMHIGGGMMQGDFLAGITQPLDWNIHSGPMPNATFDGNGAWRGHGPMGCAGNSTNCTAMPRPGGNGMRWGNETANGTAFQLRRGNSTANATQLQSFRQAVASGDYQSALQLHETYGLGGPIFGKLNSTTFEAYSHIYNLQEQLRNATSGLMSQLGLNASQRAPPEKQMPGAGRGMRRR